MADPEELRSWVRGAKVGQAVLNPGYERKQTYIRAASPGHLQPAPPPHPFVPTPSKGAVAFCSGGSGEVRVWSGADSSGGLPARLRSSSGSLASHFTAPPSGVAARPSGRPSARPLSSSLTSHQIKG